MSRRAARLLTTVAFSSTIQVDTFPPANYYPDTTLDKFTLYKTYLTALSIAILVFCFILIPKRMHLHSVTLLYIPAQVFLTFGLVPQQYTDWIQFTIQYLRQSSLIGGFSMGECCQSVNESMAITS